MQLVDNWKKCWRMASFQLAVLITVLEVVNVYVESMPDEYANMIRPVLLLALPIARLVKQTKVS